MYYSERGITLVALVIMIIVLVLLATISVDMIKEDNGVIKQARKTIGENQKEAVKESILNDLLHLQLENNGRDITKQQLKDILDNYFINVPKVEELDDFINANKKLILKEEYGKYEIPIKDVIYGAIENIQMEGT